MRSSRTRFVLFTLGLAVLLSVGFLGALKAANGILEQRYPPPGRMISVGTHKLELYCFGSGSPTVVIEPGLGADWASWWKIATGAAQSQRVCVYDRAGYGWSESGPTPRTARQLAGELHNLLANAGVPGPYVLVAHSFGAYPARLFANRFAASLTGVVLVEPGHEDDRVLMPEGRQPKAQPNSARLAGMVAWLPPLGWSRIKRLYQGEAGLPADFSSAPVAFRNRSILWSPIKQLEAEKSELSSLLESEAEARATGFPPNVPLTVITALRQSPQIHSGIHERLARSSQFGRQLIAEHSGHLVHVDRPDLVLKAIREIIANPRP